MKALLRKIRQILRDRRFRRTFTRFVSGIAAIVVFVTTYALVLPAITMESEAYCGIEAHHHDESCYEEQLICDIPESDGHHHDDSCYAVSQIQVCTKPEHQHSEECYDEEGNLICGLEEHAHDEACFEDKYELVCGLEESDGHHHTDACYTKVLTCGKEAHVHSVECYQKDQESEVDTAAVATTQAASFGVGKVHEGANDNSADTELTVPENNMADSQTEAVEEEEYVPELEDLDFYTLLNRNTGIYYYHVSENEVVEDSAQITDWKKADRNTELSSGDLIRMYLSYTIPAGSLNRTNEIARYRLPGNLHLLDEQVAAINAVENGIAAGYVDYNTLTINDVDNYHKYLGVEAVEGTRNPADDLNEYLTQLEKNGNPGSEYISAVVRVENMYDEQSGEYLGQDLVFTFTPYTTEKNRNEYDASGKPVKAGQKVQGWLTLDFNMDQLDWNDQPAGEGETSEKTAEVVFVPEMKDDQGNRIDEISTELKLVDPVETESAESDDENEREEENTEETTDQDLVEDGAEENVDNQEDLTEAEEETPEDADSAVTGNDAGSEEADNAVTGNEAGTEESASADHTEDRNDHNDAEEAEAADSSHDEEPAAPLMPAMSFTDTIRVATGRPRGLEDGNDGGAAAEAADALPSEAEVTVRVEADEGTFPVGTTMVLSAVEDMDAVGDTVRDAVENTTEQTAETAAAENKNDGSEEAASENSNRDNGGVNRTDANSNNSEGDSENRTPKAYGFQAVDISFRDADGNEIEPAKPVRVALTSSLAEKVKKEMQADEKTPVAAPVVVHVDDNGNAEKMDLIGIEEVEPAQGRTEEELLQEQEELRKEKEESRKEEKQEEASPEENAAVFTTDSFSVYAIVYTVDFEYTDPASGQVYSYSLEGGQIISLKDLLVALGIKSEEEVETFVEKDVKDVQLSTPDLVRIEKVTGGLFGLQTEDWTITPLKPFDTEETLTITDREDNEIVISLGAHGLEEVSNDLVTIRPMGGILPEDAEANAEQLNGKDTETAKKAASDYEGKGILKKIAGLFSGDNGSQKNKVYDVFEIGLSNVETGNFDGFSVDVTLPQNITGKDFTLYHLHDDKLEKVDVELKAEETGKGTQNVSGFSFETTGFSQFVLSYTVDFHWEVDGQMYDYSIQGGETLSLKKLLTILGIVSEEEAQEFVDDISTVEFTNPELIHVEKVEEDITAGALKEKLKLEPEYSSSLTEEKLAEMDAVQLTAVDWALISLKAFDTEEWLKITLDDGEVVLIKVTDARDPLGLDDRTFSVVSTRNGGSNNNKKYSVKLGTKSGTAGGTSVTAIDAAETAVSADYKYSRETDTAWLFEFDPDTHGYYIYQ